MERIQELIQLPRAVRLEIISVLVDSLKNEVEGDLSQSEIEAVFTPEYLAKLDRICAEIDKGNTQLVPLEESDFYQSVMSRRAANS